MKKTQTNTNLGKIGYGIKQTLREALDLIAVLFAIAVFLGGIFIPILLLVHNQWVWTGLYVVSVIFVIRVWIHAFPPKQTEQQTHSSKVYDVY